MSDTSDVQPRVAATAAGGPPGDGSLKGQMGTVKLILTVLAVSAPLGAVAGVVPVVIGSGNGVGAPGTYVVMGVILLLFAVGFTTMTRHLKTGGAFYAYITASLGRPVGLGSAFIAIFGYMTLMLGAYGLFGVSLNSLLVDLFHAPSVDWWIYSLLCWAAVTTLGHFNIEVSGQVLGVLMTLEVLTVMALNLPVLFRGGPEDGALEPFTFHAFTSGSVGLGILFASATFVGFEATAIYRAEVRDPDRTVPRATFLSIILIALFYVFSSWALVEAFGPSKVVGVAQESPSTMFSEALGRFVGTFAAETAMALLVTSVFASVLSVHNPIARYAYSLARDGVLPKFLGVPHPRHHSPYKASFVTSIIGLLVSLPFLLSGLDVVSFYSWMFGIGAYAILILMALTCLGVVVFFRRREHTERTWNTLIAPALGFVGLLAVLLIVSKNFTLLIGGSTVLGVAFQLLTFGLGVLGVVLAVRWSRTRPAVYARIGGQPDGEATPEH
ncbi:APC family permease [Actinomadura formosensis]|uniref:APC family permease n=1 Tax=Actinomadura formosensis TaxID=60706 RepID=UPI000AE67D9A|nr:APC family permease [Actinomadura formosensis]